MYLKSIQIVNYKNLKNAKLTFGRGANTVIGENDSGKSNAMTAMRILLDSDYFYTPKRLKESDFSESLDNWRGHWIIISAVFDEITEEDRRTELCNELIINEEDKLFLKSSTRCRGNNYGSLTLFIRPNNCIRNKLYRAQTPEEFNMIRNSISPMDYEFYYTSRSEIDFTTPDVYKEIVGELEFGKASNPSIRNKTVIGEMIEIRDVWNHISLVCIDALRDAQTELRKSKNPLRRIIDTVRQTIEDDTVESLKMKIRNLNRDLSKVPEIKKLGDNINDKLNDIVGLVYSPEITIESHIRDELDSILRNLSIKPVDETDIELLGLGHLNILYIALKLVEFEAIREHQVLNIMIVEEPEAHIHTHIQKSLFENLNVIEDYTQIIMTTHSTHLSEVSRISQMNVFKRNGKQTIVMQPTKGLDAYAKRIDFNKDLSIETCIERYLDAKRSVLLFSKSVILVEGDGEEILIPALVKKCFGVSLDELGIGLINIGSIAFEYIAGIFDNERLQRHCAIITDLDATVGDAEKDSTNAAKRGLTRKNTLDKLFKYNEWVLAFYAPHTFEVDFYNIQDNQKYLESIIDNHYVQKKAISTHISNITDSDDRRYDTIITVVNNLHKGWHAILLSEIIDETAKFPDYIIEAIAFATQDIVTPTILKRIALKVLKCYDRTIKTNNNNYKDLLELDTTYAIDQMCNEHCDDNFSKFIRSLKKYINWWPT